MLSAGALPSSLSLLFYFLDPPLPLLFLILPPLPHSSSWSAAGGDPRAGSDAASGALPRPGPHAPLPNIPSADPEGALGVRGAVDDDGMDRGSPGFGGGYARRGKKLASLWKSRRDSRSARVFSCVGIQRGRMSMSYSAAKSMILRRGSIAGPRTAQRRRPSNTVVLSVKITSRCCLKDGSHRWIVRSTVCISFEFMSFRW